MLLLKLIKIDAFLCQLHCRAEDFVTDAEIHSDFGSMQRQTLNVSAFSGIRRAMAATAVARRNRCTPESTILSKHHVTYTTDPDVSMSAVAHYSPYGK